MAKSVKKTIDLVKKFHRQDVGDKRLHLEAVFWLGMSRFVLRVLPFRWVTPFLGRPTADGGGTHGNGDEEAGRAMAGTVSTVNRHLPWTCTCLAQAIAGKMMLQRRRIPSTLYLGVGKGADGELIAHAWLRTGNDVVLGGATREQYTVVSTFT